MKHPPEVRHEMSRSEVEAITQALYEYDESEFDSTGKRIMIGDLVTFECSQMYQKFWIQSFVVEKQITWHQYLYLIKRDKVTRCDITGHFQ